MLPLKVAKSAGGRAGGLVNAVLRRYLRERRALNDEIAGNPAARHASPGWLAERLRTDWPDRWTELLAALDARAPMWLRADRRRTSADAYSEILRAAGMPARPEPRVPQALELLAPRDVADLPGFADGIVSVQDLGAQCVAFALALEPRDSGFSMPARRLAARPPSWPSASRGSPGSWRSTSTPGV